MKYTDLIFDLYGTLVDIHTEENDVVWEKTAIFFGFYGAHYTTAELKSAFRAAMAEREAKAGQSYECFPDIPFETVMAQLLRDAGITDNAEELGKNAAQLFRNAHGNGGGDGLGDQGSGHGLIQPEELRQQQDAADGGDGTDQCACKDGHKALFQLFQLAVDVHRKGSGGRSKEHGDHRAAGRSGYADHRLEA